MFVRTLSAIALVLGLAHPVSASCIGVVPAGAGHMFWKEIIRGAEAASEELKIEAYARGPSDESNASGQLKIIDRAVAEGCKGFVLAPNSAEVVARVGEMAGAGTPTVYIDRDMGGDRLSVVMTDNHAAGMQAGREMAKLLGGTGKVGLLRMDKGVSSTTAREDGFRKAAEQAGLEIVLDEYIGASVGNARKNAEKLLSSANLDGVFTPNESTTVGTTLTLEALGKNGSIHHVGFDFTPALKDAILKNDLAGVMVQQPYMMGYLGVKTLSESMNGVTVKETLFVEPFFVNKSNIETPEIKDILGESSS